VPPYQGRFSALSSISVDASTGNPNGPNLAPWPEDRSGGIMLKIQEGGSFAAGPPTDRQIARFNFLDGYLTSASIGQP
jgi:hypothetical protein